MVDTGKHLQQIERLVEQGKTAEAVRGLFALIQVCVKHRDFAQADTLRERLFEVDPMALNEIVQAAELIDAAKSEAIDPNHNELWLPLYHALTPEEQTNFFFSLVPRSVDPGQVIFRQGQKNATLWMIDGGHASITYNQGGLERLIRNLGPGEAAGVNSFLNASLCTATLTAKSTLRLQGLEVSTFAKWQQEDPGLASKVTNYFAPRSAAGDALTDAGHERREYPRQRITGPLLFQVIATQGRPVSKPIRGELEDVSAGGISFLISTSNSSQAKSLLGRRLKFKFGIQARPSPVEVTQTGTVTAVVSQPFSEYSVHIKFDRLLDKETLLRISQIPESQRTALGRGHKAL